MSPSAFLLVFSDPGTKVTLDEFHDWYNTEHIPLRLNHLPEFLSGARYQSTSDNTWVSVYEVSHPELFSQPSYTTLRENRSPREANLVNRLALLDRRCYHIINVIQDSDKAPCGFQLGEKTTKAIVTYGSTTDKPLGIPTSLRTHVLKLFDYGTLKDGASVPTDHPEYHVVHEFSNDADAANAASIINGPHFTEVHAWKLYRAYPCLAQGNLQ
ncbi:hypothetical protein L218DRAFT_890688 [Marasmius fiardii PR-910]|nr:hypothetical protein L218DRAFT_890688 [Marasmius fiardii PR-910]